MSVVTRSLPKAPAASIEIEAWPLRDQPVTAGLTISLVALVGIAVNWVAGSWLLAMLAVALTAMSSWRVFIRQRFEFSASGISQQVGRRKRRIAWGAIGRCEPQADGILLLRVGADAPLDVLNGLFIPLGQRRDEVLTFIEQQLARRSAPLSADSARSGSNKDDGPA